VGSQDKKIAITTNLLQSLRPVSVRFLTRILAGKLRLGFSEMTLLDAFSWMLIGNKSLRKKIEQAYNVFPDIGFIGQKLKAGGIESISKIEPVIGIPILMAKAERVSTPEEIIEKIGECAVEPKFDGFRLQLHKDHDKITIYSRNLENITFMYPDLVEAMKTEVSADRVIIEGEAVGYNKETQEFLPFQETAQRKRKYDIQKYSKAIPLKLFVFDLLYINNQSYINKQYTERKAKLESVVRNGTAIISIAKEQIVKHPQELVALFEKASEEGLEGVIAKKLTGLYQAGARAWNWIKFKHSYSSKLTDTIDCLVMGYDYGKGKRAVFGIGAFLVGVYNKEKDEFVTVAKIGTGLTDDEWRRIKKEAYDQRLTNKPVNYIVNKQMEVDVWTSPKIVVEIRADEISKSTVHTAGYALRFPRLERFRTDKKPNDITTKIEIISMLKAQKRLSL
jgi:DNA ligase 1